MARNYVCDVPGCGRHRKRWQRICEHCFPRLPGDIRTAIIDAHRHGRRSDWRAACRRAGEFFAGDKPARSGTSHISSEEAFHRNQRLLGER